MLIASLLLLVPASVVASAPPAPVSASQDANLDAKIRAAGADIAKLLELAKSCAKDSDARKVYRAVIALDANHEPARKALGHQLYDGKWFESLTELTKYKRDETARMKEKGLARFKERWVPESELPFHAMGWVKDANGKWANPHVLAREKEEAERKAAGFLFRADDNSWVAPSDVQHWTALRWKCGEEWVELAQANEFHSKLENAWELVGEHFTVVSTCDWAGADAARWYAEKSYPELVRIFGLAPARRPEFVVLASLDQYNAAAGGARPLLPDAEGYSSLHGAYFADLAFDFSTPPAQFFGCGVSFWDRKDEKLRGWGPYWLRWAAAQSFVDAIDPSWGFIGEMNQAGAIGTSTAGFWAEKRIPRWFRYGAASYVERYMKDPEAAADANPWGLREFAFGQLQRSGGLRKLDEVFAFALDLTKLESSARLYHEAGLVVSFLLDGAPGDQPLAAAHDAFRNALKAGDAKAIAASVATLQKELSSRDSALRKFAGLQ